jgi:hypothetical protein
MPVKDIVGQSFGRLTVKRKTSERKHEEVVWLCLCECGKTTRNTGSSLRSGNTTSCGCYKLEKSTKHGQCGRGGKSREFNALDNAVQRCTNPKHPSYYNYGERGIRVCSRWTIPNGVGMSNFIKDMGLCPKGYELERENNDGDYRKSNCKWITRLRNNNNKRTNVFLTYKGNTMTISDWARKLGIKYATLWSRVKMGWSTSKILNTRVQ